MGRPIADKAARTLAFARILESPDPDSPDPDSQEFMTAPLRITAL
jgi:hypothetical protein